MMLAARQGALRVPRLAFSVCPSPAESSRQAQVRAAAPPSSSIRSIAAAFSTTTPAGEAAAAQVDGVHNSSTGARPSRTTNRRKIDDEWPKVPGPIPASRPYAPVGSKRITAGEEFARQVHHDSVAAFLSIAHMSREELATVNIRDVRTLVYVLTREVDSHTTARYQVDLDKAKVAIRRISTMILNASLAARPKSRTVSRNSLRNLFRACIIFRDTNNIFQMFCRFMVEQNNEGNDIVNVVGIATDLAEAKEWYLITRLFPGVCRVVPQQNWSPELIALVMRANLAVGNPAGALAAFSILPDHTPETFGFLIQAHLELGELDAAQRAVVDAAAADVSPKTTQLSILRGYSALGHDELVEERVRGALAKINMPLDAAVLNNFLRLRIGADDYDGAAGVLREFSMFGPPSGATPNQATISLAISLVTCLPSPKLADVQRLWKLLVAQPGLVNDGTVAQLCRGLDRMGLIDAPLEMLKASVTGAPQAWALPDNYRPGVIMANAVLHVSLKHMRFDGLTEVAAVMKTLHIEPDAQTIIEVLKFANHNLIATPISLARLLNRLVSQTNVALTTDQVNMVLGEAVSRALKRKPGKPMLVEAAQPGGPQLMDPEAIKLRGGLSDLLDSQITHLAELGHKSNRSALSQRLRYDSLDLEGGPPPRQAIQATWRAFVLRGFRPDDYHYRSLMEAYVQIGEVHHAEEVVQFAREDGIEPGPKMFHLLIRGWAKAGNITRAREVYDLLLKKTKKPTASPMVMAKAYASIADYRSGAALIPNEWNRIALDPIGVATIAKLIGMGGDVAGGIIFIAYYSRVDTPLPEEESLSEKPRAVRPPQIVKAKSWHDHEPAVRAHQDQEGHYVLRPEFHEGVRQALKYMVKRTDWTTERDVFAFRLAMNMLSDDTIARPVEQRSKRLLNSAQRKSLAHKFAVPDAAENKRLMGDVVQPVGEKQLGTYGLFLSAFHPFRPPKAPSDPIESDSTPVTEGATATATNEGSTSTPGAEGADGTPVTEGCTTVSDSSGHTPTPTLDSPASQPSSSGDAPSPSPALTPTTTTTPSPSPDSPASPSPQAQPSPSQNEVDAANTDSSTTH